MVRADFPAPEFPFPMQGPALKRKLDEIVSPRLAAFDVAWLDDYRWVQPGNVPIRRIINFRLMKGAGAIMSWGYSLGFVPAISGSRLSYHRTQKSAQPDVFEFESTYVANVKGGPRYREVMREVRHFDATLEAYLREVIPQIEEWFARIGNICQIESELEHQCRASNFHHPSPMYVLSFVKAARGERVAAQSLLREWLNARAKFTGALGPKLIDSLVAAVDGCPEC